MTDAVKRQPGQILLEVSELVAGNGDQETPQGISLKVRAGEVVGLAGPGGAGKTAFFDCLSGITEPVSGEIRFAGRNLVERVTPATARLVELAARLFLLVSVIWLPLVLGVVWPKALYPYESGLFFLFLTFLRFYLVRPLVRHRSWSRVVLLLFVTADAVCAAVWLWQSGQFAEVSFFGLFPFYPLLVPGALVLLMTAPVLFFLFNLPRVREAFGEIPGAWLRTDLGLVRTFQEARLYPALSVLDNVKLGRHCRTRSGFFGIVLALPGVRAEERDTTEKAAACLRFVGLGEKLETPAGALGADDRRRLEIARALAAEPRLLLLDEPAAGMSCEAAADLAALVARISQAGIAVLLAEQEMNLTPALASRVYVIDHGGLLAAGSPARVRRNPKVIAAYLGARHAAAEA